MSGFVRDFSEPSVHDTGTAGEPHPDAGTTTRPVIGSAGRRLMTERRR